MDVENIIPYFANAFWLLTPIFAFNILFMRYLPSGYHDFDKDIPRWIGITENLLRILVFILPLVMQFHISTPSQKIGLGLYIVGTLIYFIAWGLQILLPLATWSTGMVGFMAPAFTPALFLAGIGLIGDHLTLPEVHYTPWIYWGLSGAFLAFHNLHAAVVFIRSPPPIGHPIIPTDVRHH